jgi:hypothetical protein
VRLRIFDLHGRQVRTVLDEFQSPVGYARTVEAAGMAPGAYVCRLEAGGRSFQRALDVMR